MLIGVVEEVRHVLLVKAGLDLEFDWKYAVLRLICSFVAVSSTLTNIDRRHHLDLLLQDFH